MKFDFSLKIILKKLNLPINKALIMKYFTLLCVIIMYSTLTFSQKGNVEIIKDSRIDQLIKQEGASLTMTGYRIQLFFDSNKASVDEARSRFISTYPKIDTYVFYTAPNYFLKVGDFRTKIEAEKVKSAVETQYPTSFIVKEKVNLPRIDQ
jgi:hypothetical protein